MIKLYNYPLSVNCYKQRLMLAILGLDYESIPIDFYPGLEHKGDAFAEINPHRHIPVIDDDGYVLWDANAILIYLATKYDPSGSWYPIGDPERLGRTASWLQFAEGTTNTASAARLHVNLGYDFDIDAVRAGAHRLFRLLDEHLWFQEQAGERWIVSGLHPTIADLAIFPDVILSEEGGISRVDYPALRRWTDRVKRIPGFVTMPGIFATTAPPLNLRTGSAGD